MGKKLKNREARAKESTRLRKQMTKLWNRAQSDFCEVQGSVIHGLGVYSTQEIPSQTKIIEYVGELIDKGVGEARAWAQHAQAEESGGAAVYIFNLSKHWDLDGDVPWNTARLINHSCEPNCEAWTVGKRIFIHALRDIETGEELTFDYGFDIECYQDHPCRCGSDDCVGFIVSREQWGALKERLGK